MSCPRGARQGNRPCDRHRTGLRASGSATLKLYGERITDTVDQVPIGADAEAPGNLDEALRYGAELTATLLLDRLGWRGGKLDVTGRVRRSELTDPLTGAARPISLDEQHWLSLNLRHDVAGTHWAWGAGLEDLRETPFHRLDYRRTFTTTTPIAFAFIEHKDRAGLRRHVLSAPPRRGPRGVAVHASAGSARRICIEFVPPCTPDITPLVRMM